MSVRAYKKNGNKFSRLFNENCCPPSQSVPQTMLGRRNVLVESECCPLYNSEVGVPEGHRCIEGDVIAGIYNEEDVNVLFYETTDIRDISYFPAPTFTQGEVMYFRLVLSAPIGSAIPFSLTYVDDITPVGVFGTSPVPQGSNYTFIWQFDTSAVGTFHAGIALSVDGCGKIEFDIDFEVVAP